ncbi:TonB family protein [Acetobacter sp. LMG 1627]|uniref:TonB family protein n=1 Tax=Acetobacter conturbans TaxID=1737472 RepID=A0ABX0K3I9_9PROT|nr:TonB family protein [Acetobacter conturbans]
MLFSGLLHALLLAFAIYMSLHHHPRGNPQATEAGTVDMMFVTPPAESGMKGEHSDQQAGGSSAAQSSQSSSQEEKSEAAEGSLNPTPETPAAPPLPQAPSDESYPKPTNETAPINQASNKAGSGSRETAKQAPHRQAVRQAQRHQRAPSPFDSLTDLSLDQSSAPPRPNRHGRTGGSGGPIDLSIGPLVQNGRLNAPFATRSTVRGVSDDYSEEVDRWIRRHMYYPEEAAQNGEEGPSSVHVIIDRTGRVRFVRLTNQSGSYMLDAATTGMFRNAELPPIPPGIPGDHFDLDVTVNYILIRH